MRARPRPSLRKVLARAPASLAIVAVELVAFALTARLGPTSDVRVLVRAGALERSHVWAGEPWRLVTAIFLHGGPLHLAMNVASGLVCPFLEASVGTRRFVLVYLASGVAGSATSLLGHDVVSAGASGAIYGAIGAMLALHRRGFATWRAYLANGGTRLLAAMLVVMFLPAAATARADQFAHAGGFAAGTWSGWLATRPAAGAGRRWGAWAAFGGALAALVLAAAWPRSALTAWEADRRLQALDDALRRGDRPEASRLVAEADARGQRDDALRYDRALLRVQEGDLDGALALLRPLAAAAGPLRDEARHAAGSVAANLAWRAYTGHGAPRDPWRGLALFDEACALGERSGCSAAARIRGAAGR